MNNLLEIINSSYQLKENENGEFESFKVKGLKFTTKSYYAESLGNVSIMEAKGFFGLMKMITIIINPFDIDAPLYSYDRIKAFGNDLIYCESYNTLLDDNYDLSLLNDALSNYSDIPEQPQDEHWYDNIRLAFTNKKVKSKLSSRIDSLEKEALEAYLGSLKNAKPCDNNTKRLKAREYSEGLLTNGGPATDPVKEAIGKEKAEVFFRKVLFATDK